jgi:hypothetical protein
LFGHLLNCTEQIWLPRMPYDVLANPGFL